jgi:hypothetical protein
MSETISAPAKTTETEFVLYCANHPTVETSLRCGRCEKPICPKCAVATPTGYRCKECIRGQQKVFETAVWYDYPLAFVISFILGGLGSYLASIFTSLWWYIFVVFLAPTAGFVIAESVRYAVRRRRSLRLWQVMAAGIVLGSLPLLLINLIFFNLWALIVQGFFLVTATSSAVARLRGINIR